MAPHAKKMKTGTHCNSTAWVAHKHQEGLKVTDAMVEALGWLDLTCEKCVDILTWRKKYGKYKLSEKPGKCHLCGLRKIGRPHHSLCQDCACARKLCAKCERPYAIPEDEVIRMQREKELKRAISDLPERYKRSAERKFEKGELAEAEALVEKGQKRKARVAQGGERYTKPHYTSNPHFLQFLNKR